MKIGNVSQTITPVPNFFMDNKREIDAFKIHYQNKYGKKKLKRCNSYFRHQDLFNTNYDINLNNNPRVNFKKFDDLNKEIYIPIYKKYITPNNTQKKDTYFPDIIDKTKSEIKLAKKNIYKDYLNYKKIININEKLNPRLRDEIMNNTYNLIERINSDYDLKKYTNFDTRTTFNKMNQTAYSNITNAIKKTKSQKDLFRKTLKDKVNSLKTINSKIKKAIQNNSYENDIYLEKIENKKNPEIIKSKIYLLLDNCKTNLINLKYNNKEPINYNKKDQKFIEDNKYLTSRINRTKLFKNFPSKTRMEFNIKKIKIPKKLMKYNDNSNHFTKEQYGMDKNELNKIQNDMWTRALHSDAYRLYE